MRPERFKSPFPDNSYAKAEGTSIYFELATESAQHVRDAVSQFDPSIMLFLKKLNKIDLIIDKIDGRSETHFVRKEEPLGDGSSRVTIVRNGTPVLRYMQFCFPFKSTVKRKQNQENRSSDIKFGFPVSDDFQHIVHRDEKVYACLPVNNYGFKVSPYIYT